MDASARNISTLNGTGIQNTSTAPFSIHGDVNIGTVWDQKAYDELLADLRVTDPSDDKKRIEETKGGLLSDSYRWILDHEDFLQCRENPDSHLLWIKGDPGKGKTMLLCGIIDELSKASADTPESRPAYFFCQATDERLNSATAVLRGLLYMLVYQHPSLVSYMQEKYKHAGKKLFEDANAWIAVKDLLTKMLGDTALDGKVLIIDALDECVTDLERLLAFVSTTSRAKWIVSSRNWPTIEYSLDSMASKIRLCLELNAELVADAVKTYIQDKLAQLADIKKWDNSTFNAAERYLTTNSNDTFLWVALVCQKLAEPSVRKRHILSLLKTFPPGLDHLYRRMINLVSASNDADLCRQVLAIACTVYRPLTTHELLCIMQFDGDLKSLEEVISSCGSFLTIRNDTVFFIHQSAKDFLLNQASYQIMPSGIARQHHTILQASLKVLSKTLRRDIYDLRAPAYPAKDFCPPKDDPLASLKYSCVHWTDHVQDSIPAERLSFHHPVHGFLRRSYLYWLEVMSLLGSLSQAVLAMRKLRSLTAAGEAQNLTDLVYDAHRFVLFHKLTIEEYPLQVYASALVFSPEGSLVRGLFLEEVPTWILRMPEMETMWTQYDQILPHDGVKLVVSSPNGRQIASGCLKGIVRVWDTETSTCLQILTGPSVRVQAMIFSSDGKRLFSGFLNGTVWEWDVLTGTCIRLFDLESGESRYMAFAPDCNRVASVIADCQEIRIWDKESGARYSSPQLFQNIGDVRSVSLAPDGGYAAAGFDRGVIYVWDVLTGTYLRLRYDSDVGPVISLAFSPDSKKLVSGTASPGRLAVWKVATGALLHTLAGDSCPIRSISYSLNGKRIVSASENGTIRIWDSRSGGCSQVLEQGGQEGVSCVTISPDGERLASYEDVMGRIRIWDVRTPSTNRAAQMLEKHEYSVSSISFSQHHEMVVSGSHDGTVRLWKVDSGKCLGMLDDPWNDWCLIDEVAFSPDSTLVASASEEGAVHIWEATTGALHLAIQPTDDMDFGGRISFSADGKKLVMARKSRWEALEIDTGAFLSHGCHDEWARGAAISSDGRQVALGSGHGVLKIWTSRRPCAPPRTVETPDSDFVFTSVIFSPDERFIAASGHAKGWKDWAVFIWEVELGTLLCRLDGDYGDLRFWNQKGLQADHGAISQRGTSFRGEMGSVRFTPCLHWIMKGDEPVIRVPPEYQPACRVSWQGILIWGCQFGRVYFLSLSSGLTE